MFVSFTAAVSTKALKAMRQTTRKLIDLSKMFNPILRGWMEYYGKYSPSGMLPVFKHFNCTLRAWAMRKYKRLKGHKTRAALLIEKNAKERPSLFVHWKKGMLGFA